MTGVRDGAVTDRVQEEEGRGSQGALGGLARKVISRRLSWDPTKHKDNVESQRVGCLATAPVQTHCYTNHRPLLTGFDPSYAEAQLKPLRWLP